ncbi:MAG: pyridoxamine 5'-phosphate oxidase [Rhodospirillales bacterium 70-18]|nr:pyridoxamine 5'-phosphate oxidase family protein [Rhodospirillales bacterium]OJY65275.1 MAG: pyridoxamine 5'-phosphate oxidase [Rhodospirillales bacterium 70-18]
MRTSDQTQSNPFHEGERAAQLLAGVVRQGAPIRPYMPAQHREFFAGLSYLPAAVLDAQAGPVATLLSGAPGFVASPDDTTLSIAANAADDDPFAAALRPGAAMAVLGIDLATRRRNRANGRIIALPAGEIVLKVAESFGNCPQYIQARPVAPIVRDAAAVEHLPALDAAARAQIGAADTFFIATVAPRGMDISHRGGRPGFVRLEGARLSVPDFAGNRYFNTLGNLLLDPRAALLFVDFASGDLLHVSGRVEIDWAPAAFEGAERVWHLDIAAAWRRRTAVPLRWGAAQPAPTTLQTGVWPAYDSHTA